MIIGIGIDAVDIERIEVACARHGDRFTARLFTACEVKRAESAFRPAASLAKRFAAKEAFAKALGTGLASGLRACDIEVVNDERGRPSIVCHGAAQVMLEKSGGRTVHLSLSDTDHVAQAFVVIESGR